MRVSGATAPLPHLRLTRLLRGWHRQGNEFGEEACERLAALHERRLQYQALALDLAPYRVDGRAMVCRVDPE